MRVRDLMARPPITARVTDDVALALQIMAWAEVRHLPVLSEGEVVGVVSERDLLANAALNPQLGRIVSTPVVLASPDDDAGEAGRRMIEQRIGCLPVVDQGMLVGILTMTDLVADHVRRKEAERATASLTVRSAMTPAPMTATPEEFLLDAVGRMGMRHVRHLPVVDADNRVVGMLSDGDVRLALGAPLAAVANGLAPPRIEYLKVREAMSSNPVVTRAEAPLSEAAQAFVDKRIGALPVVDSDRHVVGILSYVDALRVLASGRVKPAEARLAH